VVFLAELDGNNAGHNFGKRGNLGANFTVVGEMVDDVGFG
jgi:hypothetical protein